MDTDYNYRQEFTYTGLTGYMVKAAGVHMWESIDNGQTWTYIGTIFDQTPPDDEEPEDPYEGREYADPARIAAAIDYERSRTPWDYPQKEEQ